MKRTDFIGHENTAKVWRETVRCASRSNRLSSAIERGKYVIAQANAKLELTWFPFYLVCLISCRCQLLSWQHYAFMVSRESRELYIWIIYWREVPHHLPDRFGCASLLSSYIPYSSLRLWWPCEYTVTTYTWIWRNWPVLMRRPGANHRQPVKQVSSAYCPHLQKPLDVTT